MKQLNDIDPLPTIGELNRESMVAVDSDWPVHYVKTRDGQELEIKPGDDGSLVIRSMPCAKWPLGKQLTWLDIRRASLDVGP